MRQDPVHISRTQTTITATMYGKITKHCIYAPVRGDPKTLVNAHG